VMARRTRREHAPTRRFHVPSAVRGSPARIDAAVARELVADGAILVDVRRLDDPAVTLDGAVRIPPDEIPGRLEEFPRDTPIVLACG
jgi:rhodanese-related sulfurtransferase